jgi:hypothetical protein
MLEPRHEIITMISIYLFWYRSDRHRNGLPVAQARTQVQTLLGFHTHTQKKTSRLNRTPTSTTPSGLRTPTPPLQSCCCSAHAPKLPGSRASARTHARPEGEATGGRGAAIAAGVQRSAETFCVAAVTPRHPRSVTRPPIHPFLTHSPPAAAGGSWAGHVATQPSPRPWRARETRVPATTILRGNLYY